MTVNPVSIGSNYVSQVQPRPQTQPERAVEKESDKDRDDKAKLAAVQNEPKPAVNTQGQAVGAIINVKA